MSHTPGPWIGHKHSDAGWDIDSPSQKVVDDTGVIRAEDAKLITASPDMLALLTEVSCVLSGHDSLLHDIQAVISKATGA